MEIVKTTLPEEIKEQALKVSDEKQKEVLKVLTDIFNGTSDWEKQVDKIKIKDVNDSMSIALAETARKNAKDARLDAEKIFDAKRSEVQLQMADYKLEDSLWLKSKQIMQLKFKHIEEKAKFKSEFVKRYESEQRNLRTESRLLKVHKYDESVIESDIEDLTDDIFNSYLTGLKNDFEAAKEAEKKAEELRLETERLQILRLKREDELKIYWQFVPAKHPPFESLSEDEWNDFFIEIGYAKENFDKEQEEIRKENERLKKEAEIKAKLIKKQKSERTQKAITFLTNKGFKKDDHGFKNDDHFIGTKHYDDFETDKEFESFKIDIIKSEEVKATKKENQRIQKELDDKKVIENKAQEDEMTRVQAELNKGDELKVKDLINDLTALKTKYTFKSQLNNKMYKDVGTLIDKVINHIN